MAELLSKHHQLMVKQTYKLTNFTSEKVFKNLESLLNDKSDNIVIHIATKQFNQNFKLVKPHQKESEANFCHICGNNCCMFVCNNRERHKKHQKVFDIQK